MTQHIDFGYDSDSQMYFEVSENLTVVVKEEQESLCTQIFLNGQSKEFSELTPEHKNTIKQIQERYALYDYENS